jgi:CheY-like chemotaxis protein
MDSFMMINSWLVTLIIGVAWFLVIFSPFFLGLSIFLAAPPCAAVMISNRIVVKSEKRVRVLMVDDQPSSLIILEHFFKSLRCEYKVVSSGWDAIKAMKKEAFDLIIMDYEMPQIGGPETLLLAESYSPKQNNSSMLDQYSGVPVIGFTATQRPIWQLPSLKRFKMALSLNKQSDYGYIKEQIFQLLPHLESRT